VPVLNWTPTADCGEYRTVPTYYPYLTGYVDVGSAVDTIEHNTVLAERPRNRVCVTGSVERFFCSP
jgi:hypothetical protein